MQLGVGHGLLTNMFLLHLSTAVASNIWGLGKNIPACSTEQQNRHKDFSWALKERSTHIPAQSSAWTVVVSNLSDLNASDPTVYLSLGPAFQYIVYVFYAVFHMSLDTTGIYL